jgi:acyl carrier protein
MSNEIEMKLRNIIKSNSDAGDVADSIGIDEDFAALGLNSVSFIRIVVVIETEFEFEFDDEDLDYSRYENLGKMITYIESKVKG